MPIHIEADLNADICVRMIDIHITPVIQGNFTSHFTLQNLQTE